METLRAYVAPALLIAGWMLVAGYVLSELSRQPAMPTIHNPEVIIEVIPLPQPS